MGRRRKNKSDEPQADAGPALEAGSYTLRRDRQQEFRRTIKYESGVTAQLVFKQGVDVELTQEEVDGLESEIACGMIVPTNRDDKGRQRVVREVTPEATATICNLEQQVEELSAKCAELTRQLGEATAPI